MSNFAQEILRYGEKNPNQIALKDEFGSVLTYGELEKLAKEIACYAQEKNLPMAVPVTMGRRVETVAVYLGLNLSGRMFAPLSHTDPIERVEFIANQMESSVVFDQDRWTDFQNTTKKNQDIGHIDHNQEYCMMIYTSGSTGLPKGVIYKDFAIISAMKRNLVAWNYGENKGELLACSTAPFNFSAIMIDLFTPLFAGVTVHILGDSVRKDGQKLVSYLKENKVTHCFIPPQMLSTVREPIPTLHQVVTGSDRVANLDPKALGFPLKNLYASSETTVAVTEFIMDKAYENTPVGKPLLGMEIYLLDEQGNLAEEGEIYVAGAIASGYFKMPEATAKSFLPNPFAKGEHDKIMFRSGDVGKRLPDGNILYLNRRDWMVKINGNRVELGEIEVVLSQHPEISKAVVKGFTSPQGQTYLVGYYIANASLDTTKITKYLEDKLPSYMCPAFLVQMESFPINANGKLDRLSLESPDLTSLQQDYDSPQGEVETVLCQAMAKLLGLEKIGRDDQFAQLGGDSIQAIRLTQMVSQYKLSTVEIHRGKTPQGMALLIEKRLGL